MGTYKKEIEMKALLVLLALTVFASTAYAGCNGIVLVSVSWNSPSPSLAEYDADYQPGRGTSDVLGSVTFTFSNGTAPFDDVVDTIADDLGGFSVNVPAYTTSIDLDVTLSNPRRNPKRFQCISP